ncbi:MAG TPA: hypothetical protein VFB39_03550 [Solirubrobacteraceae bacterium]|nr:hypothetical protein [Solirubrobacteraceae bacterium]
MHVPDIELLWWAGCPSTEKALGELEAALQDAGISGHEVRMTEIQTEDQARERAFAGSPTILVDGADVAPPRDEPVGLNCRVYRRRDGSVSPTPDPEVLRDALRRAQGRPTPEEVMR